MVNVGINSLMENVSQILTAQTTGLALDSIVLTSALMSDAQLVSVVGKENAKEIDFIRHFISKLNTFFEFRIFKLYFLEFRV